MFINEDTMATDYSWTIPDIPIAVLHRQPPDTSRRSWPRDTKHPTYQTDLRNLNTSIKPQWDDILVAATLQEDRQLLNSLSASEGTGRPKVKPCNTEDA